MVTKKSNSGLIIGIIVILIILCLFSLIVGGGSYFYFSDPKPIDCEIEWGEFNECSRLCGGGTKTRFANITKQPKYGGMQCPLKMSNTIPCNDNPCPINCKISPWSSWSDCDKTCGGGSQTRNRTVITHSAYGGIPCPQSSEMSETKSCNAEPCPVDCEENEWPNWDTVECANPTKITEDGLKCGDSKKIRTRTVKIQPQHGGKQCVLQEETSCPSKKCPIKGNWGEWSECSKICNDGIPGVKTRKCNNPIPNKGDFINVDVNCVKKDGSTGLQESETCNNNTCPKDCEVTWSDWTKCIGCGRTQQRTADFKMLPKQRHGKDQVCPTPLETRTCPNCTFTRYDGMFNGTSKLYVDDDGKYINDRTSRGNVNGYLFTKDECKSACVKMGEQCAAVRTYKTEGKGNCEYHTPSVDLSDKAIDLSKSDSNPFETNIKNKDGTWKTVPFSISGRTEYFPKSRSPLLFTYTRDECKQKCMDTSKCTGYSYYKQKLLQDQLAMCDTIPALDCLKSEKEYLKTHGSCTLYKDPINISGTKWGEENYNTYIKDKLNN